MVAAAAAGGPARAPAAGGLHRGGGGGAGPGAVRRKRGRQQGRAVPRRKGHTAVRWGGRAQRPRLGPPGQGSRAAGGLQSLAGRHARARAEGMQTQRQQGVVVPAGEGSAAGRCKHCSRAGAGPGRSICCCPVGVVHCRGWTEPQAAWQLPTSAGSRHATQGAHRGRRARVGCVIQIAAVVRAHRSRWRMRAAMPRAWPCAHGCYA